MIEILIDKTGLLSQAKRVTLYFRSFIFNGIPHVSSFKLHAFAKVWRTRRRRPRRRRRRRRRRRFHGVTTPPKRIHIFKNQLCSMEANSARGAHVQL